MKKRGKSISKLFWFLKDRADNLDFHKDRHMIIHQVLALGSMDDVRNIMEQYGKDEVRKEF